MFIVDFHHCKRFVDMENEEKWLPIQLEWKIDIWIFFFFYKVLLIVKRMSSFNVCSMWRDALMKL